MTERIFNIPWSDTTLLQMGQEAEQLLEWLAQYGKESEGGITRLLYDASWIDAQLELADSMRGKGLLPYFDACGNLFGRIEGTNGRSGIVLTGSHIDTVTKGGRYDGAYGIVASLLVIEYLYNTYGPPAKTIEVVSFAEEEGSRFPLTYWGSGSVAGLYTPDSPPDCTDAYGNSLQDAKASALQSIANKFTVVPSSRREDIDAFVELHIEQGAVLEKESLTIGIVQAIAGQCRFTYTVEGETNHAGTTPMRSRKDALCGAAEMVLAVNELALRFGEPIVATVGSICTYPGVSNAVAGKVTFTLDVRHPDPVVLNRYCSVINDGFTRISDRRGLTVTGERWMDAAPVPMDKKLSGLLGQICTDRAIPYRYMYSGAGHDSQVMAAKYPTALLFIPSRSGISHAPEEYSEPAHLAAGIAVLADILYVTAYGGISSNEGEKK